jgi:ABC-type multidrug transport system fused ATPase/permease subunit
LRPGEIAVVHGPSGGGKTSLLNLIAGILQHETGVVCVDRSATAYVSQETPLLDATIRENLLFGLAPKNDEELWRALAAAGLDKFVSSLPHCLDAQAGDNGALISGGERQRLGLARAILRGSQLLLLDEATSALDEENETRVLKNLVDAGVAALLVTHRRRAHSFAQRAYRLAAGELVEVPHSITKCLAG